VAAAVNGLLVLLVPIGFALYAMSTDQRVRPSGWPQVRAWLRAPIEAGVVAMPFAMVAAWRTWVHARLRRQGQGSGWKGVLEGGALGLALALLVLAPGIVLSPLQALPYVVAYGGLATAIGLVIAFVLRLVALAVLRRIGGLPSGNPDPTAATSRSA